MTRIEWTRRTGDDVEAVVSMLLCGENFDAWRVQPGQGDGGIDVFVPVEGDLGRRRVYQVKRYADRLTSSQKRKIKRSLKRVLETREAEGWKLEYWALVAPLDPTPGEIAWFEELTAELDCEVTWMGLARVEYLVSKHPAVVDYYLRDGKERLAAQMDALTRLLSSRQDRAPGEPLRPEDVRGDFAAAYRAINECDPHYRYGISVSPTRPIASNYQGEPGLVAVSSSGSDAEGWVTILVYARSRESLIERPITASFQLLTADERVSEDYRKFLNLGTPVTFPPGSVSARLDLPGGLAADLETAALSIEPRDEHSAGSDEDEETELVLAVVSPEQEVLSEVLLQRTHLYAIPSGGQRTVWKDTAGLIRVEIIATQYPDLTINFSIDAAPGGRVPDKVAPSLRFASCLHEPNTIATAMPYGPRKWSVGSVTGLHESRDESLAQMARIAESLATIQSHTNHRVRFPKSITQDQAVDIVNAAKILSGEPVSITWKEGLRVDRDDPENAKLRELNVGQKVRTRIIRDLSIEIDEETIVIGRQMAVLDSEVTEISDEVFAARPVAGSTSWLMRYDGDEEPGRAGVSSSLHIDR